MMRATILVHDVLGKSLLAFCFFLPGISPLIAEAGLNSFFPLGGQQGTSFDITIRGEDLQGVCGVWFDCQHLTAEVKEIKQVVIVKTRFSTKLESPGQDVLVRVNALPEAASGVHAIRLLTKDGISNPLPLLVTSEPIVVEQETLHHTAATAQPVTVPVNLCGKIGQRAELDYYSFEVREGQTLQFEVLVTGGILPGATVHFRDPELILYDLSGSWFDSQKAIRLEALDESTFIPLESKIWKPRLRHRFERAGRYVIRVGSRGRLAGLGYGYQLWIKAVDSHPLPEEGKWTDLQMAQAPRFPPWQEREFSRKLNLDRCRQLWSRTARKRGQEPFAGNRPFGCFAQMVPDPFFSPETGANATLDQPLPICSPVLIEGSIGSPGEVDHFSFDVKSGQALAFEVETTNRMHPDFSPLMEVSDAEGQTTSTNIYRSVELNSAYWLRHIQSKMILTFEKDGKHILRVRDLTSRRGGPDFTYRLLIRPQVPHIGKVTLQGKDGINLMPGETKQLTVSVDREEGFHHPVELFLENLPPGTQAAAVVAEEDTSPRVKKSREEVNRDWFFPIEQKIVVTLVADDDAQVTSEPHRARLMARARLGKSSGQPLPVQDLLVMVVSPDRVE